MALAVADSFAGEHWPLRAAARAARDLCRPRDLVAKLSYTIYGYDVRRVYYVPEWVKFAREGLMDVIMPGDHNVKVDICRAMVEAMKRVRRKLEGG